MKSESAPQEKKSYVDERLWKPELDKSGNGYAVLRFLPAVHGEDLPWRKYILMHSKGQLVNGTLRIRLQQSIRMTLYRNIIRNCGNTGIESDKEIARKQKRKLSYYSNVYVVSDPKHPEREGQVFLFRYGKKIYDKLLAAMQPEFEDESPINPFDPFSGANFKLKIRKVDGYWNYDKSEFEAPSKLFEDEAQVETVCSKSYALTEFTNQSNFKSYDELKTRLDVVLSGTVSVGNVAESMPEVKQETLSSPQSTVSSIDQSIQSVETNDEDDTMSYFEKLG